jgi:hypothetical protein
VSSVAAPRRRRIARAVNDECDAGGRQPSTDRWITVSRMPEEKQDPANTQMFRAFVERNEPEAGKRGMLPALLLLAAALVVAVVAVVLIVS